MNRAAEHCHRKHNNRGAHGMTEQKSERAVLEGEQDSHRQPDQRKPRHRCGDIGFARRFDRDRKDGEKAERETDVEESPAARSVERRVFLGNSHRIFSDTPALWKVAIWWNKSSAASMIDIASAAPVPSPRRMSRSRIGRARSHSSASR